MKTCRLKKCSKKFKPKNRSQICPKCTENYSYVFTGKNVGQWLGHKFKTAKNNAEKRGIKFDIVLEDLYAILPPDALCPIMKTKFRRYDEEFILTKGMTASLDRIDSSKGYTPDNIWIISNKANNMKSDSTPYEMVVFANWVRKEYGEEEENLEAQVQNKTT